MQPHLEFDPNDLSRQTSLMKAQLAAVQAALAEMEAVGTAGNGLVRVTMTATGDVRSVHVDPSVVDPGDVGRLESLVREALQDAVVSLRTRAEDTLMPLNEAAARIARSSASPSSYARDS